MQVPVEVLPAACATTIKRITELGGEPALRQATEKDGPLITDQGNFILDVKFPDNVELTGMNSHINNIPGVLGHGIFTGLATKIVVGRGNSAEVID